jgi:hypothetical protein
VLPKGGWAFVVRHEAIADPRLADEIPGMRRIALIFFRS